MSRTSATRSSGSLPFQVYQSTNSTLAVGMLGLAALIPVFVFPIVSGPVADGWSVDA